MLCPCFKNRSYALFRASMKRLPKMETIVEEVYVTVKEPDQYCEESDWIELWQDARWGQDAHWGQWADIEYDYIDVCYEPRTAPPAIR
jgi:hypothetical protein